MLQGWFLAHSVPKQALLGQKTHKNMKNRISGGQFLRIAKTRCTQKMCAHVVFNSKFRTVLHFAHVYKFYVFEIQKRQNLCPEHTLSLCKNSIFCCFYDACFLIQYTQSPQEEKWSKTRKNVFLKKKLGQKWQKLPFLMKKQGLAKTIPPSYRRFGILKRDLGEPIRFFEKTRFLQKMHEKTRFYVFFHGLIGLCQHRTRKNHQKHVFLMVFDVFLTIFSSFH